MPLSRIFQIYHGGWNFDHIMLYRVQIAISVIQTHNVSYDRHWLLVVVNPTTIWSRARQPPQRYVSPCNKLTGSKTNIRQSKWTASCVAWLESVYKAASEGGLCAVRLMWALAPSQDVFIAESLGVPKRSVIRSSWNEKINN